MDRFLRTGGWLRRQVAARPLVLQHDEHDSEEHDGMANTADSPKMVRLRLRAVDNQKLANNTMEEPGAVRHQVFDHLQASHGSMR